ncbi:hypothetical protein [Acinetobacter baumannii]|jgi:hypothetical protein|uniref:hypothetical protein n=1 Tax=Acinetobacter baumannii TaxID=470 RepID=UPI002306DBFC|nr:hypothetical protein [Acinetobacter baumannii]MDB0077503.1 hypothetical protein [Acinetobacter baumannii]
MFDSNLAKKFLEKINTMSFEELDARASQAPSSGIAGILDELPCLELVYEIFEESQQDRFVTLLGIENNAYLSKAEEISQESFPSENLDIYEEPEPYALAA